MLFLTTALSQVVQKHSQVWWETIASTDAYFLGNACAKHYENSKMLSQVTAKNVGDVFFETRCTTEFSIQRASLTFIFTFDRCRQVRELCTQ